MSKAQYIQELLIDAFGHIDVIKKSLKLFEKLIVAVSDGENKEYLFDVDERIEIVKKYF